MKEHSIPDQRFVCPDAGVCPPALGHASKTRTYFDRIRMRTVFLILTSASGRTSVPFFVCRVLSGLAPSYHFFSRTTTVSDDIGEGVFPTHVPEANERVTHVSYRCDVRWSVGGLRFEAFVSGCRWFLTG